MEALINAVDEQDLYSIDSATNDLDQLLDKISSNVTFVGKVGTEIQPIKKSHGNLKTHMVKQDQKIEQIVPLNVGKSGIIREHRNSKLLGALLDTGVQCSVIGPNQARIYCELSIIEFKLKRSHHRYSFRLRNAKSLGMITIIICTTGSPIYLSVDVL